MLEPRRLLILAAAVREGSLTAAARSLGITPSAVSQALGALETQVGQPLLVRNARGVSPTPTGEKLAAHAEAIRAQLVAAETEVSQPTEIRLASFATAVVALVAPALRGLSRGPGSPLVTVAEVEPDPARAALERRDVDVALVNHSAQVMPDGQRPWHLDHILDERLDLVVPSDHKVAGSPVVDLRDLADEPWVMQAPASPCQAIMLRACADAGFAPRTTATCASYDSIQHLVAAGHGLALIPRLVLAQGQLLGVTVSRTARPVLRRINALTPADRSRPVMADIVIEAIREQASRLVEQEERQ